MAMNGPIPSSIIQMAQQFYQQDGSFGMAKQIYMNNDDTHFWWGYTGSINFQTENEVRNHLYHLRTSIKKKAKKE